MSHQGRPVVQAHGISALSEHTVVDVRSAVKIDPDVPLTTAALVSCGVATGWGSVTHMSDARPGDVVILIGYGQLDTAEARELKPHVVFVDADNKVMATGYDPAETFGDPTLSRGDAVAR